MVIFDIYIELPHGINLFDLLVVMNLFFAIAFQQKSLGMVRSKKQFARKTVTWIIMNLGSIWLVVWNIFYFPIYWEISSQLTNIFQRGSNHQPVSKYGLPP